MMTCSAYDKDLFIFLLLVMEKFKSYWNTSYMSSSDSTARFVHSIGLIILHGTRGLVLSVAQATCAQTLQVFPDLCTWSQQISTQKWHWSAWSHEAWGMLYIGTAFS